MNNVLLIACIVLLSVSITIVLVLGVFVLLAIREVLREVKELVKKTQYEIERFGSIVSKTSSLIGLFRPSLMKIILAVLGGLFGVMLGRNNK